MPQQKKSSPHKLNTRQRLVSLAVADACAMPLAPAFAQDAGNASGATAEPGATATVVTGIRASMQSTLNLKRSWDGIVADGIGKFPDISLAESLQGGSGVSLDRERGEGASVTVRGGGPDLESGWRPVFVPA